MINKLLNMDVDKLMEWGARVWIVGLVVGVCGVVACAFVAIHFIAKAW